MVAMPDFGNGNVLIANVKKALHTGSDVLFEKHETRIAVLPW